MDKIRISDVAEMANVSRGTVDRVLHGRGHVDPEVEKRILVIINKLNYRPSRAARQLSLRKRNIRLGLITRLDTNGFWSNLLRGANEAIAELNEYGITTEQRFFNQFLPDEQLARIDELVSLGISALIIVPLDDERIRQRLIDLRDTGIPVYLINSEISDFTPTCYVGSDYYDSGRTAAGLMHRFANRQPLRLAVFTGNDYLRSHRQRLDGFLNEMEKLKTDLTLVERADVTSDFTYAYNCANAVLADHPEINSVFTIASNVVPVCSAISDAGRADDIIHIGYGMTNATRPLLQNGSLTAAIGTEASRQGSLPFQLLLQYFLDGSAPCKTRYLTRNEIFISQNANFT